MNAVTKRKRRTDTPRGAKTLELNPATVRTRQRRAGLLAFSSSCELTRHGSDVASRRRSTRCNGCASGTPGSGRGSSDPLHQVRRRVSQNAPSRDAADRISQKVVSLLQVCGHALRFQASRYHAMLAHCAKRWSTHRSPECGIAGDPTIYKCQIASSWRRHWLKPQEAQVVTRSSSRVACSQEENSSLPMRNTPW